MPAEYGGIITVDCLFVPGEVVLGAFPKLRKVTVGFLCLSVRPRGTLDGFGMKFDIWGNLKKNVSRKCNIV